MTIDVTIPYETRSLIRPLQRTFYPARIPPQHPQLRKFISTTDPNVVYYASEQEVYALHLSKRKRELIASLPWEPQCLDAGYGWICVGGRDNGRCAFIYINEKASDGSRSRASQHQAEVDALLPLDLDPESRLLAQSYFDRQRASAQSISRRKPEVQIHELGGSIVNSVTVHRLLSNQKGFDDEDVVLLTNNDRTIRIFSLSQSKVLETLRCTAPMNYASISPDGNTLVAVGDAPTAFFFRRVHNFHRAYEPISNYASCKWELIAKAELNAAYPGDACFTTAFSPSGHICAVASQAGIITIFETSMVRPGMEADDAVVDILKSTRPSPDRDPSGAVRSMSFAPSPWDLFAWAESRGRVCVVDLRTSCRSRQTIELDLNSPSLNRADLSDLEDSQHTSEQRQLEIEARFVQRHREALNAQDNLAAVSHAADYMEHAAARRRLDRELNGIQPASERREFNDLTESERQILESIRSGRLRDFDQPQAGDSEQSSFNINYLQNQSSDAGQLRLFAELDDPPLVTNPSTPQLLRIDSMRELMRRRAELERTRTADRSAHQPRRRSSIVITSSNNNSNQSSSSQPQNLAPLGSSTPTLSASPSRFNVATARNSTTDTPSPSTPYEAGEAWRTITDAMANTPLGIDPETEARLLRRDRDRDRDVAATGVMLRRVQQQQHQNVRSERVRNTHAQRLRQWHERTLGRASTGDNIFDETELDMLRRLTNREGRESREDGVKTMGIGWDSFGRNLYVATEDGILEFTVNIDDRKTFPGMALQ